MSSNSELLRRIFHDDGPPIGTVSNSTVWSRRNGYTSSTGAQHAFALFRVHNSTDSDINWNARFHATAYSGWSNRASVAINGQNLWCPSSDYGANHHHSLDITIPANRTSTVIFSSSSHYEWSSSMSNTLIFKDNSLDLPAGLEFVDDLDVKPDGWEH